MGWFKKEAKAFGKEFLSQSSLLLFGKTKKKPKPRYKDPSEKYQAYKRWAKAHGFD